MNDAEYEQLYGIPRPHIEEALMMNMADVLDKALGKPVCPECGGAGLICGMCGGKKHRSQVSHHWKPIPCPTCQREEAE